MTLNFSMKHRNHMIFLCLFGLCTPAISAEYIISVIGLTNETIQMKDCLTKELRQNVTLSSTNTFTMSSTNGYLSTCFKYATVGDDRERMLSILLDTKSTNVTLNLNKYHRHGRQIEAVVFNNGKEKIVDTSMPKIRIRKGTGNKVGDINENGEYGSSIQIRTEKELIRQKIQP